MTEDLERVRPDDRDRAIAVVESAYAAGRIVEQDRTFRIEQIRAADLRGELQALVRDLPAPPPAPPPGPAMRPAPPQMPTPPRATAAPPRPQPPRYLLPAPVPRRGRGKLVAVGVVVAIFGLGAISTFTTALTREARDGGTATETSSAPGPDLLTRRGYADLVDAVEEKTGRREAFELVLYSDQATIAVPVNATSRRQISYIWDGEWREFGGKGTSTSGRFSLDDVEGGLLRRMVTRAQGQVDDPTAWYVVIRPGMAAGDEWTILAIATNDFGETATVRAGPDGKIEKL